jgi:hypothetical protein
VADGGWNLWQWSFNGPVFTNVSAGSHKTCLKRFAGETMHIDAILVQKL